MGRSKKLFSRQTDRTFRANVDPGISRKRMKEDSKNYTWVLLIAFLLFLALMYFLYA